VSPQSQAPLTSGIRVPTWSTLPLPERVRSVAYSATALTMTHPADKKSTFHRNAHIFPCGGAPRATHARRPRTLVPSGGPLGSDEHDTLVVERIWGVNVAIVGGREDLLITRSRRPLVGE